MASLRGRGRTPGGDAGVAAVLSAPVTDPGPVADALGALTAATADLPVPLQVVLAPWGPGNDDALRAIAGRVTTPVTVVAPSETGNAARNAALTVVRAPYVVFLGPRARLRPGGLAAMLAAADPRRAPVVHAVGPGNPVDPAAYLFATEALRAAGPPFDETHGDFAEVTCARALAGVPALIHQQVWDRAPAAGAALGAMPSWSADLEPWLAMVPAVRQVLAGPPLGQWARDLVTDTLPGLLADAERLPYDLLPQLADVVGAVLAALPPADLARIPVADRAAAWLGGQARWGDLAEVTARRALADGQFPTRAEGARIFAELPGADWSALHAPPQMLELGLEESRLATSVRRVRWLREADGSPVVAVDVYAVVTGLGLANPTIQARWVGVDGALPATVRPRTDPEINAFSGQRYVDQGDGSVTVLTRLDSFRPGPWHLELAVTQGGVVRTGRLLERDLAGSAGALRPAPDGRAQPAWDDEGLRLDVALPGTYRLGEQPRSPMPGVRAIRVEDDWLAVDLTGPARGPVLLASADDAVAGHVDGATVRFLPRVSRFGSAPVPLPSGRYRLLAGSADLLWDPTAEDETRFDLLAPDHRVGVRRTPRHAVSLDLRAPLRDDEIGPFGQSRLLRSYDVEQPVRDIVLLESAGGTGCTGSPLAIDRELARSRPHIGRVWAVADHSVVVPDDAERVLRGSREWHLLLATARLIVTDGELPVFFTRRSGQELLQTLSGYPARNMGVDTWNLRNYAPRRIEHLLARSAKQWSALVAPSARQQHWFRESFRYDGDLLAVGLPRTDLVVDPIGAAWGLHVRERLGVTAGQTVVLYAPEPGAHPDPSPRPREILDVAELAEALGPAYTVLLRDPAPGRMPVHAEGARVLDVTAYPEVSDLMHAADAAVFDYSALRFDFALTGKPMIFQVPDPSVRAGDSTGFLIPYAETAPGPVVASAAEVASLLADLPLLHRMQATPLAKFNAEFNDMADGHASARVLDAVLSRDARPWSSSTAADEAAPRFRVVR